MEWACEVCTLLNSSSRNCCEACGSLACEPAESSRRKRKLDELAHQNASSSTHKAQPEIEHGPMIKHDSDVEVVDVEVLDLCDSDDSEPIIQPAGGRDDDGVEILMGLTCASRSASIEMLSSHGGDLGAAINSFFDTPTAGPLAGHAEASRSAVENCTRNASMCPSQHSGRSKLKENSALPTASIYISGPSANLKCEDGAAAAGTIGCKGKKRKRQVSMGGKGRAADGTDPLALADGPSSSVHEAPPLRAPRVAERLYGPSARCSADEIPEEEEEEAGLPPLLQVDVSGIKDSALREDDDGSEDSDWETSSRRSTGKEGQEEADRFDDTDDDDVIASPPEQVSVEEAEPVRHHGFNVNRCLPASITYKYVEGYRVRERTALPAACPHPREDAYPGFLRDFFLGRVAGCAGHNWSAELARCTRVEKGAAEARLHEGKCLAPWQAGAYKYAQKVLSCSTSMKGSIFWWTPGSGKSVMVALLIELLFSGPQEIFVVSTPQNTRENGYVECLRSLLQFSPMFASVKQPSTSQDFNALATKMRQRKPALLKTKHFLSLRQFENAMRARCEAGGPHSLQNIAVIVDECHELSNPRLCDQRAMWEGGDAILPRLAQGRGNKLLLLSGTPWRDEAQMLRLLNLVSGRSLLSVQPVQSEPDAAALLEKIRVRAKGIVSYVDGSSDRSTFPDNGGWRVERCGVGPDQLHNFAGRSRQQLQRLGLRNLCELARLLSAPDETRRKEALRALRLAQVASAVYWGSVGSGLCGMLQRPETATLDVVRKFAPKFAALARNVLWPELEGAGGVGGVGDGRDALRTRHFVYSGSEMTITNLSKTLSALRGEQRRFRQLHAEELEWTDAAQTAVRLLPGKWRAEDEESVVFVVVRGSASESKKLKAAFGFVTADSRRYEGLQRTRGGLPLVQVLLGSHETNQGLTFLRLQRIHLMEPNPLGWGKVVQTMGRGVRRGTHLSCTYTDLTAPWFRRVETIIYAAVLAPSFLANERAAQREELEEKAAVATADYARRCGELRVLRRAQTSAADASALFVSKVAKKETKIRNAMRKLVDEREKLAAELRKVEEGWLRVDVPGSMSKRTGKARRVLVQTWRMLPDEAVLHVTGHEHQARQRFDDAVRAAAVDAKLLEDFHAAPAPAHAPTPASAALAPAAQSAQASDAARSGAPPAGGAEAGQAAAAAGHGRSSEDLAAAFELAALQYLPSHGQQQQQQPAGHAEQPGTAEAHVGAAGGAAAEAKRCLSCCQEASAGSVCSEGHFVCGTCERMLYASAKEGRERAAREACAEATCAGFRSEEEKELRKFPPYWSHQDAEGVHFVKVSSEDMEDRVRTLIQASVRKECPGSALCPFGDGKAWGSISKVLRVENGPLWQNYCERKVELVEEVQARGETDHLLALTEPWQAIFEDVALEPAVNEFFLFHGTQEAAAKTIATHGFDLTKARGGLYGAGIYAADSACKSLFYCRESGTRVLLLCRVMMGPRPYRTKVLQQTASAAPVKSASVGALSLAIQAGFDSIFAEHGVAQGGGQMHSEFMVYDNAQILPEYLVYVSEASAGD